jgi:hypothetical protein
MPTAHIAGFVLEAAAPRADRNKLPLHIALHKEAKNRHVKQ